METIIKQVDAMVISVKEDDLLIFRASEDTDADTLANFRKELEKMDALQGIQFIVIGGDLEITKVTKNPLGKEEG